MPLVKISLLNKRNSEEIKEINDGIHRALVKALKIPEYDYNHQTGIYSPEEWIIPANRNNTFIQIEIIMFLGRAKETKKKIFALIAEELGRTGISADNIFIVINELPMENWSIRNGQSAEESAPSFQLKV